jgi:hypothetical protein
MASARAKTYSCFTLILFFCDFTKIIVSNKILRLSAVFAKFCYVDAIMFVNSLKNKNKNTKI